MSEMFYKSAYALSLQLDGIAKLWVCDYHHKQGNSLIFFVSARMPSLKNKATLDVLKSYGYEGEDDEWVEFFEIRAESLYVAYTQ